MERGSEPRAPLSEAGSGWQLGNKLRALSPGLREKLPGRQWRGKRKCRHSSIAGIHKCYPQMSQVLGIVVSRRGRPGLCPHEADSHVQRRITDKILQTTVES